MIFLVMGCAKKSDEGKEIAIAQSGPVSGEPGEKSAAKSLFEVDSVLVRDISGVGARLKGAESAFRAELVSQRGEPPFVEIKPDIDAPLIVELLNICAESECQLVAKASLSQPMESGLRARFTVVAQTPMDGIEYRSKLPILSSRLRSALFAQLRAKTESPDILAKWLVGDSEVYRDAALRAVVERQLRELAPQIAQLMSEQDEGVALLAVAAAGVLGSPTLLGPLEKVALGSNLNLADAALQALADIGTPQALSSLATIAGKASSGPLRSRVESLLEKFGHKVSPSSPTSDKHNIR